MVRRWKSTVSFIKFQLHSWTQQDSHEFTAVSQRTILYNKVLYSPQSYEAKQTSHCCMHGIWAAVLISARELFGGLIQLQCPFTCMHMIILSRESASGARRNVQYVLIKCSTTLHALMWMASQSKKWESSPRTMMFRSAQEFTQAFSLQLHQKNSTTKELS